MSRNSRAYGSPRAAALLLLKDARIELRTRETILTSALFALVLVTLFVFSGFEEQAISRRAAPGVLWVSIAFTGSLIFSRTFQREREDRALGGLILVPDIAGPLYAAKLALNVVLLGVLEVLLVPAVLIVLRAGPGDGLGALAATLALGTLGLSALGTVLAAALATVRLREVLLPIVLYPLAIPLLVAGVQATRAIISGEPEGVGDWLVLMAAFDVLFVALGRWLFGEALDAGEQ
jgi:heme exporter protein CcmB